MANKVTITIDTKANVTGITAVKNGIKGMATETTYARGALRDLLTAAAGFFAFERAVSYVKSFFTSVIDAAKSVQNLTLSLDTLTHGQGKETFKELDDWAARMPVNTEKAIDVYRKLVAMGLKPSIEQMTILVDTVSALGGGEEGLNSIARALGQMSAKGKVSAEELMQLAEAGVPAYQILTEQLGITGKAFDNLSATGLTTDQVITALFKGMKEKYGGLSSQMMNTFDGAAEALDDSLSRMKRAWASYGIFDMATAAVVAFTKTLDDFRESNQFQDWAKDSSDAAMKMFSNVILGAAELIDFVNAHKDIVENGILGKILLGKKGMILFAALDVIGVDVIAILEKHLKYIDARTKGFLTEVEIATSSKSGLDKLLSERGYEDSKQFNVAIQKNIGEIGKLKRHLQDLEEFNKLSSLQRMGDIGLGHTGLVGAKFDLSAWERANTSQAIDNTKKKIMDMQTEMVTLKANPQTATDYARNFLKNMREQMAIISGSKLTDSWLFEPTTPEAPKITPVDTVEINKRRRAELEYALQLAEYEDDKAHSFERQKKALADIIAFEQSVLGSTAAGTDDYAKQQQRVLDARQKLYQITEKEREIAIENGRTTLENEMTAAKLADEKTKSLDAQSTVLQKMLTYENDVFKRIDARDEQKRLGQVKKIQEVERQIFDLSEKRKENAYSAAKAELTAALDAAGQQKYSAYGNPLKASENDIAIQLDMQKQLLKLEQERLDQLPVANEEYHKQEQTIADVTEKIRELTAEMRTYTASNEDAFRAGLDQYLAEAPTAFDQMKDLAYDTAQSMEQSFSDLFFDAMRGQLDSLADYVQSFAESVMRSIANIYAQQLAYGLISSFSGASAATSTPAAGTSGYINYSQDQFLATGVSTLGRSADKSSASTTAEPNVVINFTNNSSASVQPRETGRQFNGKDFVIGVILEDISNSGQLRTAIKAVAKGA